MTESDRQAIVASACTAIERLVPKRFRQALAQHFAAAEAAFGEQARAEYARGRADAVAVSTDAAFDRGFLEGVLSVEARADRRDLDHVLDAPELRLIH